MTELDLRGLRCPLPALHTARRLAEMTAGETLIVLADDPLAAIDIAHLCRTEGHDFVEQRQADEGGRFVIVAGGA
ncbi:MAG: response regulator SirA [Fulvimarina sp.]|nr:response regulator SirA [Fulvimarina sp.]